MAQMTKYTLLAALEKNVADDPSLDKVEYLEKLYEKESKCCAWGSGKANDDPERYTRELVDAIVTEQFMNLVRQVTVEKFLKYYKETWSYEMDLEIEEEHVVQDFADARFIKTVQTIIKSALQKGIPSGLKIHG
jgi:hypothetical protein